MAVLSAGAGGITRLPVNTCSDVGAELARDTDDAVSLVDGRDTIAGKPGLLRKVAESALYDDVQGVNDARDITQQRQ